MSIRSTGFPHSRQSTLLGLVVLALMTAAGRVQAHEVRFVASYGSGNLCTRAAPCGSLQRGIDSAPAGGEVIVLDSGDHGAGANINKSLTISAVGVTATLGGSITIDATGIIVVLRGLRLNGEGVGGNGIAITTGESGDVHIDDCEIDGFDTGINVDTEAYPRLTIANSAVRNNSINGIYFRTGSPGQLVVDRSRFEHNGWRGIEIEGSGASITRTVAAGNGLTGIHVSYSARVNISWTTSEHNGSDGYSSDGYLTLERSVARGNARYGLSVGQYSGIAVVSGSAFTDNNTGIFQQFGPIFSRGNNTVSGNVMDLSGSLTPLGGM